MTVLLKSGAHRETGDRLLQDELEGLHRRRRRHARPLSVQHTKLVDSKGLDTATETWTPS